MSFHIMDNTTNIPALNVLYLVMNEKTRIVTRALADGMCIPIAGALVGGGLLLINIWYPANTKWLTLALCCSLAIWLAVTFMLRREYLRRTEEP
nr:MAG: hypothetical protein BECKLPF1236C_GA0070990_102873 [Candidatus Kentron sp. LPFa]